MLPTYVLDYGRGSWIHAMRFLIETSSGEPAAAIIDSLVYLSRLIRQHTKLIRGEGFHDFLSLTKLH